MLLAGVLVSAEIPVLMFGSLSRCILFNKLNREK